jgi:hypothetical protein
VHRNWIGHILFAAGLALLVPVPNGRFGRGETDAAMRPVAKRLRGRATAATEGDTGLFAFELVSFAIDDHRRALDEIGAVGANKDLNGLGHETILRGSVTPATPAASATA